MGRLSTYAKNQILKLRFQKHHKITQIVKTLTQEDHIKVSRQSVSTFLKKYLETESILDKPRSGRKRKLTADEIALIGEVTRNNREITARAIKEYLNLNVSTYTILRATKLFEWNKLNPNSNAAKKAAAIERQMRGEGRKRKTYPKRPSSAKKSPSNPDSAASSPRKVDTTPTHTQAASSGIQLVKLNSHATIPLVTTTLGAGDLYDMKMLDDHEIVLIKNNACSPMSFATKILFKIFAVNELHGHNVSGKTFHKHIEHKQPLEEKRLMYIRWLVEKYFACEEAATNKEVLWKSCCNAINKMIRRSEVNAANKAVGSAVGGAAKVNLSSIDMLVDEDEESDDDGVVETSQKARLIMKGDYVVRRLDDEDSSDEDSDDDDEEIELQQQPSKRPPASQLQNQFQQQIIGELNEPVVLGTSEIIGDYSRIDDDELMEATTTISASPKLPIMCSATTPSKPKQFVVVAAVHQPQTPMQCKRRSARLAMPSS